MYDLTGFHRDLLYMISGWDALHGLAIKDKLEDYYKKKSTTADSTPLRYAR
jgi:hypothetical protein